MVTYLIGITRSNVKLCMGVQKSWIRHWKQQVNLWYYITTSFVIIWRFPQWNKCGCSGRDMQLKWRNKDMSMHEHQIWVHIFAGNLLKDYYCEDYSDWGDNIRTPLASKFRGALRWVLSISRGVLWVYATSCNQTCDSLQNLLQMQLVSLGQTRISNRGMEWNINLPKHHILNYTRTPSDNPFSQNFPDKGI